MDASNAKPALTLGYFMKNFLWDIILMAVLLINLLLICFDWFFSISDVSAFFRENMPGFFASYGPIHSNMKAVDLAFVLVYVADLAVGWAIAVLGRKENSVDYLMRHWYDVLGCIPAGSLVFLRLLRIVSILMRLHKRGLVRLHKYAFFRKCLKIYGILLEEVSDRVVLNILGSIKSNLKLGMPITREIIEKIVVPHKREVIDLALARLQDIAKQEYALHRHELAHYIEGKSRGAVDSSKELRMIGGIPVVGSQIREAIERAVSGTVVQVVDALVSDAVSKECAGKMGAIASEASDLALKGLEKDISGIVTDVAVEAVDIIARVANIKQWKLAELSDQIAEARRQDAPDGELISRLEADYQALFASEIEKQWS